MGNSNSPSPRQIMLEKEDRILEFGRRWFADWRKADGDSKYQLPVVTVMDVPLNDGEGTHIHTVKYQGNSAPNDGVPLVLVHGYGSGKHTHVY
jgi:hypothetical protein